MLENIKKNRSNKGFTLLETVVSTSIIMIAVISLLIVSQDTILIIFLARDRLTAAYLAKEGMETIRNRRDQNFLRGRPWSEGISSTATTTLLIDADRFYNYTTGTATKFNRSLNITFINPDIIRVRAVVGWDVRPGFAGHTFVVEENLYNWR